MKMLSLDELLKLGEKVEDWEKMPTRTFAPRVDLDPDGFEHDEHIVFVKDSFVGNNNGTQVSLAHVKINNEFNSYIIKAKKNNIILGYVMQEIDGKLKRFYEVVEDQTSIHIFR